MARRFRHTATSRLYAIEIATAAFTLADFRMWRIEIRNVVDYRRRADRWWSEICMTVWRSADGRVRGIIGLGSLTPAEIASAFDTRWAATLRPIDPADLRSEILKVIDPAAIAPPPITHGRYHPLKFSISAQRSRTKTVPVRAAHQSTLNIEPMPILL